jgi:predicted KAP-like P-loop ATPase
MESLHVDHASNQNPIAAGVFAQTGASQTLADFLNKTIASIRHRVKTCFANCKVGMINAYARKCESKAGGKPLKVAQKILRSFSPVDQFTASRQIDRTASSNAVRDEERNLRARPPLDF